MSKRILIMCLVVACFCFVMITQALTQEPITCRELQVMVQGTVGNEDPAVYKNHGAYVSTVANLVDPYLESAQIDSVCASCIVNQFARRIPIEEQVPCEF
jgi:YbbR domain-containing protein